MNNLLDEQEKKREGFSPIKFENGVERYNSWSCLIIFLITALFACSFLFFALTISSEF